MRSNSPSTIVTVPRAGSLDVASGLAAGDAADPPVRLAQRWPTGRGPQLGDKGDGLPIRGQEGRRQVRWVFDAICEATVIDDGSRRLAIKKNRPVGCRRGPGGPTSLGVDDAEGGT
jgi:hypothetical protein